MNTMAYKLWFYFSNTFHIGKHVDDNHYNNTNKISVFFSQFSLGFST